MARFRLFGSSLLPAIALALAMPAAAMAQSAPAAQDDTQQQDQPQPVQQAQAPAPGQAQVPGPAPGSAWTKVCSTDPATKKELCLVLQELHSDNGQVVASATIRQYTGDTKISFIAAVPPGMLLQPGIRAQVDTGKQYQIKYGICYPNACYGELDVDTDFITALKGGTKVIITTLNQQAKGVSFPMSLAGFTKTFDGKGVDAASFQGQQDDLNKALQARAEEARKKLIEQQQKEAGNSGASTPAPAN